MEILAFLPAGGLGERLRPLTSSTPKPLIQVGNEQKVIDYACGVAESIARETIVTLYYQAGRVRNYLQSRYPKFTLLEDPALINIGGSLALHFDRVKDNPVEAIAVLPTDHFLRLEDIKSTINVLAESEADIAMPGSNSLEGHEVYLMDDQNNLYAPGGQRNPHRLIAGLGIYIMKKGWLEKRMKDLSFFKGTIDLTKDVVFGADQKSPPQIKFYPLDEDGHWSDLGTFDHLYCHILNHNLRDFQGNILFPNSLVSPQARVSNSIVYPGAEVKQGVVLDHSLVYCGATLVDTCDQPAIITASGLKVFSPLFSRDYSPIDNESLGKAPQPS